jgi:tRNA threonylcarbamoyladenosine biosynthesis protein TsaE
MTPSNPNEPLHAAASESTWSVELPTRRATLHLAQRLAAHLRAGDLVILVGPLGAGKTFFVRGVARALGLPASEPVTSPTFALVSELATPRVSLVHADLYRLGDVDEVHDLGLLASRDTNCLLIEWGRPYVDALGGDALIIELTRPSRRAAFTATGRRSAELLQAVQQTPTPRRRDHASPTSGD